MSDEGIVVVALVHVLDGTAEFDWLGEAVSPFPCVTDQAAAILALADAAGFERFQLVGASYGGTVALQIAADAPERCERVCLLAAAGRVHPMATAWRSVQRDMVRFAQARGDGAGGVDLARRLAMTTYRTPEEFAARFGPGARGDVEDYLRRRGQSFAIKMSAARFLALSRSMDAVDLDPAQITVPVSCLGFTSDRLVPPEDVRWTAQSLPGGTLTLADSLYGHDAFLLETQIVSQHLETSLCLTR